MMCCIVRDASTEADKLISAFGVEWCAFVSPKMNFVSQMMDFVSNMMNFVSNMMNYVSEMMNFVS